MDEISKMNIALSTDHKMLSTSTASAYTGFVVMVPRLYAPLSPRSTTASSAAFNSASSTCWFDFSIVFSTFLVMR